MNTPIRLSKPVVEEVVIERSRFIACLYPCFTEQQARQIIEDVNKQYSDATHVCTAYVLQQSGGIQRSNDNKEPSGTAGMPMLKAILNSGLTDTLACVVRYFGGIKLGAGGLIRAYSSVVTQAIVKADKLKSVPSNLYQVTYPYDLSGAIESWLRSNTNIQDIKYDQDVTCIFETQKENITQMIQNLSKGKVTASLIKTIMIDEPI